MFGLNGRIIKCRKRFKIGRFSSKKFEKRPILMERPCILMGPYSCKGIVDSLRQALTTRHERIVCTACTLLNNISTCNKGRGTLYWFREFF